MASSAGPRAGHRQKAADQLFNGYGEFVADLYREMEGERLFTRTATPL
jgi:hypothetical protein